MRYVFRSAAIEINPSSALPLPQISKAISLHPFLFHLTACAVEEQPDEISADTTGESEGKNKSFGQKRGVSAPWRVEKNMLRGGGHMTLQGTLPDVITTVGCPVLANFTHISWG